MNNRFDQPIENTNNTIQANFVSAKFLAAESGFLFQDLPKESLDEADSKTLEDAEIYQNQFKVENDNLVKKNYKLTEENIRLKCSFEAEKYSANFIYGAKIESLEKELQQVLYENHHLRQQMSKMRFMIWSLVKIV